jgi:iron complex outermembrane receptor protein
MRKTRLYVSVVAIYAAFGGVASAQAVDPDAGQGFNDIVVTAQRREQKLQDVPASVTSLSGDTLLSKGVQNTQDLTIAVPGLFWARSTNFNQPTIRGVGNRNSAPGDEPNVATYLDDEQPGPCPECRDLICRVLWLTAFGISPGYVSFRTKAG